MPIVGVLICAALVGCGDSGDGNASRKVQYLTEAERAAAAVRQQAQAIARGNGRTACALFSPKALGEVEDIVSRRAGDIGCVTAVSEGARGLPTPVRRALARPDITRVEVHGDRATVTVRVPPVLTRLAKREAGKERGSGTPLRRIDGRWKVDALAF